MNKYKKLELKIRKTVDGIRNGVNSLYDVATDCLALLKDSREYAEAIGIEAEQVAEHIETSFLADFNITLSELKAIMQQFPLREQWAKPLAVMYDEAAEALQQKCAETKEHAPKRRAVKIAEFEAIKGELADAKAEAKHGRSMLEELQRENRELREENAVLRGRIQELERRVNVGRELSSVG